VPARTSLKGAENAGVENAGLKQSKNWKLSAITINTYAKTDFIKQLFANFLI